MYIIARKRAYPVMILRQSKASQKKTALNASKQLISFVRYYLPATILGIREDANTAQSLETETEDVCG